MARRSTDLAGTRVLVAGAGLAGLSAARALQADGADVTVIDARDRVGGRVWTIRDGFAGRQSAEGGADIIETDQTPVLDLARELGLSLVRTLPGGFSYYGPTAGGRLAIQSQERAFEWIGDALRPHIDDYVVSERSWNGVIARRLAGQSVAAWLREKQAPRHVEARCRGLRGLFLADPEDMSLLELVDFLSAGAPGVDRSAFRIEGGNDRLATRLAESADEPPRLSSVLRAVRQTKRGVRVAVESRGILDEWRGDFVVAAMPACTLDEVRFEPAMPTLQRRALRTLRHGAATRVLLQFERRFWRRRGRARAFGSDRVHGAVWEGNEQQRGKPGILSLLAGGRASREIATLLERRGTRGLVEQLRWLGRPSPLLASRVVRWDDDPWARGGYAYFHPGFDPSWHRLLSQPLGRVVFAGEQTSLRWQGYMSGAVESGRRAAAELRALAAAGRR